MNKRIKLSSEEVKEPNDEVLNIDGLPEEIFEKIFGYLKPKDLCQIGRVCKKWHAITRYPVFWKRVDVNFSGKCGSLSEAAMKFVQILPSCVTHLRLDFTYSEDWALNLRDLSVILQERCPRLEVLIFHRARFITINISRATLYVCEQLMANIRVLVFHHAALNDVTMLDLSDAVLSKIEVLDISRSAQMLLNDSFVSRVPNLKKMRLAGSGISDYTFETHPSIVSRLEVLDLEGTITGYFAFKSVRNYGFHLVELYMCFTLVQDDDLVFEKPADALPRLKKVCLRASNVTYKGIISLLKSCKSLQHVCVGQPVTIDPENDYSKCNSEKVEIIDGFLYCDHYAKINYMHV